MKVGLIPIHGIECDLSDRWWTPWARRVRQALGAPLGRTLPITWEHLSNNRVPKKKLTWMRNWAGDISAVNDDKIRDFFDTQLHQQHAKCVHGGLIPLLLVHSLASVLAQQSLLRQPLAGVRLVTIGSPLWMRYVLPPLVRPRGVRRWVNGYSVLDPLMQLGILTWARITLPEADRNVHVWSGHEAACYLKRRKLQAAIRWAVE
jgi:hypothetical protein